MWQPTSVFVAAAALAAVALSAASASPWPSTIALPDGFQPEGIAGGTGSTFFVGSIPTGDIVRGDLRTGEVEEFVEAGEGQSAIGLAVGSGVLFVAGGPTGQGHAYDADTGMELASWQFTDSATFVNDVVATRDAAYFTDSVNPFLYRVPILARGEFGDPVAIELIGDLEYQDGFNVNGIAATSRGDTLVVVQSNTGMLFTVDPATGTTDEIDLAGETVQQGDGILLHSRRLWVVQNRANLLTLVQLESGFDSGEVVGRFSDDDFDVPTTVARFGQRLALVNARFETAEPDAAEYWVTQMPRPRP
ncbi:MAG: superoxide dismutase [Nitriliruptorales bacterium]|nr:superoxide dismutase [Nitriliruptorales bacterium]